MLNYHKKYLLYREDPDYEGRVNIYGFLESLNHPEWLALLKDICEQNVGVMEMMPLKTDNSPVEFFTVFMNNLSPTYRPLICKAMSTLFIKCLPVGDITEEEHILVNLIRMTKILGWGLSQKRLARVVLMEVLSTEVRQQAAICLAIASQPMAEEFWTHKINVSKHNFLAYPRMLALEKSNPTKALETLRLLEKRPVEFQKCLQPIFYSLMNLKEQSSRRVPLIDLVPELPDWAMGYIISEVLTAPEFQEEVELPIPEATNQNVIVFQDQIKKIQESGSNLMRMLEAI